MKRDKTHHVHNQNDSTTCPQPNFVIGPPNEMLPKEINKDSKTYPCSTKTIGTVTGDIAWTSYADFIVDSIAPTTEDWGLIPLRRMEARTGDH